MQLPTVKLTEGNEVQLRGLGLGDVFLAQAVVREVMLGGHIEMRALGMDEMKRLAQLIGDPKTAEKTMQEHLGAAIVLGFTHAEKPLVKWLASLLGKKPEEVLDPKVVPLSALPRIAEGLLAHPDLLDFLEAGRSMLQSPQLLLMLKRAMAAAIGSESSSTTSKADTPGPLTSTA